MMRINSFSRGVAFSALAAIGLLPWLVVAAPLLGGWNAQAAYLVMVATAYVAMLGDRLRPGLIAAMSITVCGIAVLVDTTAELAIVLAAVVGTMRSGVVFGPAAPRSIASELFLLSGGLYLARFLALPWPAGAALGIWGFFLLQSIYFLRGDFPALSSRTAAVDGFDAAYRRASQLLERGRVG